MTDAECKDKETSRQITGSLFDIWNFLSDITMYRIAYGIDYGCADAVARFTKERSSLRNRKIYRGIRMQSAKIQAMGLAKQTAA